MKILITGANGYIGKSIYHAFKDKYEVTTISRKDFDLIDRESTKNYLKDKYFDVIIHCAIFGGGRLKEDDVDVLDNNLIMYYNLLENKDSFNKFITFGSGAELYSQHTNYGLSKHIIRKSLLEKENFYNIRIFGVFNENELDTRFIKANMTRYIKKESIEIYENKKMDIFYMKDLLLLIDHYILNSYLPKEIDCTYEKSLFLSEISDLINDLDDYKVEIKIYENKDKYSGQFTDLGLPYTGLEKGIIEMYNKIIK
jgi:nucleoside-diphosphate-sugar epimerase